MKLREVNSPHFTRVSAQHSTFHFQRFRHYLDRQTRSIRPLQTGTNVDFLMRRTQKYKIWMIICDNLYENVILPSL